MTFRVYNPPVKTGFTTSYTSRTVWNGSFYTADGQEEGFHGTSYGGDSNDYDIAIYYLPEEFYSNV